MRKGILFVVSAPSGCGKTTMLNQVMAGLEGLSFSVSHTTRLPRSDEVNGKHYYFVDREEFLTLRDIEPSGFLEWAEVHGKYYGTSNQEVEKRLQAGEDVILDIDVQGADQVREQSNPVTIFIAPPTMEELERRLRKRGTEQEETLTLRLANARTEMAAIPNYQYIIINDDLEQAVESLRSIIIAERCRTAEVEPVHL